MDIFDEFFGDDEFNQFFNSDTNAKIRKKKRPNDKEAQKPKSGAGVWKGKTPMRRRKFSIKKR